MALQSHLDKIKANRETYQASLRELKAKDVAAALGEVVPDGFALVFKTYIPGFNDGDPCTFTVGECMLVTLKRPKPEEVTYDYATKTYRGKDFVLTSDDREDFDVTEGHNGTIDLSYSSSTEGMHAIGLTRKAYEAASALWKKLAKEEDVIEAAFGADVCVAIFSDGKFKSEEYYCGH